MSWSDHAWLEQAKETVARALCAALSLEWESDEALALIRYAWADDAMSHAPDRMTNVIYVDVVPTADPSAAWETVRWLEDGAAVSRKIIPLSITLTLYGPDCVDIGEYLRTRLMLDTGSGSARSVLRGGCLSFSGAIERPNAVNEPDGDMWRKRADIRLRMNLLREDRHEYSAVTQPPAIGTVIGAAAADDDNP